MVVAIVMISFYVLFVDNAFAMLRVNHICMGTFGTGTIVHIVVVDDWPTVVRWQNRTNIESKWPSLLRAPYGNVGTMICGLKRIDSHRQSIYIRRRDNGNVDAIFVVTAAAVRLCDVSAGVNRDCQHYEMFVCSWIVGIDRWGPWCRWQVNRQQTV